MGVLNEATKKGVTYLYGCDYGKTSSSHVLSVINTHILAESNLENYKHLYLTFDNCAVNKNFVVVGYAVMLVLSGVFESVEINFPIAGHTKFGPDGMFGWLGPLLRKHDLYEIEDILEYSKGSNSYSVKKMEPNTLMDYSEFVKKNVIQKVKGINDRHGIKVTKVDGKAKLYLRDYSTTSWDFIKEFNGPLPIFTRSYLVKEPLSAAKVKDLLKQEKYSPNGTLSYAHYELAPTKANSNQPPARVLPDPASLPQNIISLAYWINTPSGERPVYLVDSPEGPIFWLYQG